MTDNEQKKKTVKWSITVISLSETASRVILTRFLGIKLNFRLLYTCISVKNKLNDFSSAYKLQYMEKGPNDVK